MSMVGTHILLIGLVLLGVNCSSANEAKDSSFVVRKTFQTAKNCNSHTVCPSGEACDYYMVNGSLGTCRKICLSNTDCANQICNPLSGTCEAACNDNTQFNCANMLGLGACTVSANTAVTGYCYQACATVTDCLTAGMPTGTVCSEGVCVKPCSALAAGSSSCNQITGGYGVSCLPGSNTCSNVSYPPTSAQGALTLTGCSVYSGTCVPQGTTAGSVCAAFVGATGSGTTAVAEATSNTPLCETSCTPTSAVCSGGAENCLTNICQISCKSGGTCSNPDQLCSQLTDGSYSCQYLPIPSTGCPSGSARGTGEQAGYCIPFSCTPPCSGATPSCVATNKCGCTANSCPGGGMCAKGSCTCPTTCPVGESCSSGVLGCVCDSSACEKLKGRCSTDNSQCQLPCGDKLCSGLTPVCVNNEYCQAAGCGNGIIDQGEICDEGSLGQSCSSDTACPQNFTCKTKTCIPTGLNPISCTPGENDCPVNYSCGTQGYCVQEIGNGLNGHCSANTGSKNNGCTYECAVWAGSSGSISNPAQWLIANSLSAALTNTLGGSAPSGVGQCLKADGTNGVAGGYWPGSYSTSTITQDGKTCPCGYGVWVEKGNESNAVTVGKSINIYGGFAGTEISIYDRTDPALAVPVPGGINPAPLGQESFSGTILNPSSSSGGFALSGTSATITIDGFQILSGGDTAIKIGSGVKATLQNLRIAHNNATGAGGAIQNAGTMKLKDSMITMNTAATQGGAISHTAAVTAESSTIERVTFFGNGINSATPIPLCAAGGSGTCPTDYNCPVSGGFCQPVCTVASGDCPISGYGACTAVGTCPYVSCPTTACLTGFVCSSGNCLPTSSNSGGAISATGAASLNVYASKFNANYSYGNGGAIYSEVPLTVVSSLFTANRASNGGGGIYVSKTNGSSAKLYNLTLIDNAAYNLGGGGIYDEGTTGSSVQSSLFRDNKGLYPFNSNTFAEWAGNRDPKGNNFWQSQINSISTGVSVSTSAMSISSTNNMALSYVDMCPVMAYDYNPNPGPASLSPIGVCDGKLTCGTVPTRTNSGTITFNTNATTANTCNRTVEFLDCRTPLYRNCSPITGQSITGTKTVPASYPKDIVGVTNSAAWQGAYQAQCGQNTDCPSNLPQCNTATNTCVQCTSTDSSACTGNTPVCNTATNTCVQCTSTDSSACTGNTPACNTATNTCVQCTSTDSSACTGNTLFCDTTYNVCVQCTSSSQCPAALPNCSGSWCRCAIPCISGCCQPGQQCVGAFRSKHCE